MAFFFVHLYVPLFPTFFLLLVRVLSWCLPGRHTAGRTWVQGLLEEVAEVRPRAIAILFTIGLKCDGCVGFRPLFCSLVGFFLEIAGNQHKTGLPNISSTAGADCLIFTRHIKAF